MSVKDHADEVLSVVRSAAGRDRVHDGYVPDLPTLPYVAVYFDLGAAEPTDVNSAAHSRTYGFQTTYVGETPEQVRALSDRVEPVLLGARLDVYRTATTPVEKVTSQPVRADFDTRPPRFYAVDVWEYQANA